MTKNERLFFNFATHCRNCIVKRPVSRANSDKDKSPCKEPFSPMPR